MKFRFLNLSTDNIFMLQTLSRLSFTLILTTISLLLPASRITDSVQVSGKASFYHDKFHGRLTSNGEVYNKNDFTAAHRTLPFNTIVHVLNKENGKSVIVRINDRGPFLKSRIIDLSRSAAEKIGMIPFGIVPVRIRVMTLFDHVPLSDSLLAENDIWDCYGNKMSLENKNVLAWIGENWKHAFYTAGKILIDNKFEKVGIRVAGQPGNRAYEIIVTGIKSSAECDSIVNILKADGYHRAHTMKTN